VRMMRRKDVWGRIACGAYSTITLTVADEE
jgi:hypothetical protein